MTVSIPTLSLVGLIRRSSPKLLWWSIALSLVAGLVNSAIIPSLMHGLALQSQAGPPSASGIARHYAVLFFCLCFGAFLAKTSSLIVVTVLVKDLAADLRIRLCRKINEISVTKVEELGMARLTNMLVEDIARISFAAVCLPMLAVYAVTIAGMLGYLAYLDWRVFLCVLSVIVLGLFLNRLPLRKAIVHMEQSRQIRDQVQAGIKGVVFGAYELKLAQGKSRQFLEEEISVPERRAARIDKIADTYLHGAGSFVETFCFFLIGFAAFVLPQYLSFAPSKLMGISMALLCITLPIAMAYMLLPNVQRGQVALAQIQQLDDLPAETQASHPIAPWSTLEVRDVQYRYRTVAEEPGFNLKPISLQFRKGEVVFVVGGNGSGKSTLSKLLSLHYLPDAGEIYLGATQVTAHNIAAARESIAAIYSNYYLFDRIYGDLNDRKIEQSRRYLDLFQLSDKTQLCDGRFSTTQLSDGQRRRLALVVALLDEREVYILDEWAADQDPEFRAIFYTEILAEMRAAGKLVIVITHDDRYFAHADRVVVMEYGAIRQIFEPDQQARIAAADFSGHKRRLATTVTTPASPPMFASSSAEAVQLPQVSS